VSRGVACVERSGQELARPQRLLTVEHGMRILRHARGNPETELNRNLICLLTVEFLLYCWRFVNKKAAVGVDRQSASQYAQNLESNAVDLADSVQGGWYRAKLVLRKYIPKLNGKLRPLRLPAIADKPLQTAVALILEAI